MATKKRASQKTAARDDAEKIKVIKRLIKKSIRHQQESLYNLELAVREVEMIEGPPHYGEPCPGFRIAPWVPGGKAPGKRKK